MAQSKAMTDLLERARSLMPDYTLCEVCGQPLTNVLSVERGKGPTCELKEAVRKAEQQRLAGYTVPISLVEYRGEQRRMKAV
jgi:hypothetical protein